eukprot:CAMPEP_0202371806 /NCGR_PEP_ID=MMETSP1127-20130417/3143_1 /ASSEMBLY_ACC=CAM_ASM_000462 /TAXON_ID=3047 /ORGANISM="Dunaliella tertiolecta, Strain CCMP1320" /LENGTH=360 /DNA_ID=CAMNT_0048968171 /DNA_START=84 /DNA_END=1166 /DNA_ORIENTATION=+
MLSNAHKALRPSASPLAAVVSGQQCQPSFVPSINESASAAQPPLQHRCMGTKSPVQDPGLRAAFGYCIEEVRSCDYENYVWAAQLSKELRPAVFALRAFNVETAQVADQVRSKEPTLLQMRYQWWRDGISNTIKGSPPKHPVLLALRSVMDLQQQSSSSSSTAASPKLRQYHFKRIIDTRENDLLDPQPPLTVEGLEQYAEGTASQLLYLQLASANIQSREADHAASHLGKAVGIATLLKGTKYHGERRRSYLPVELCAKHGVSQEDVYSAQPSDGMCDVVLAVASVAKNHLDEARALAGRIPREAAPLMLMSVGCDSYLRALEACNFDPFHERLQGRGSPLSPLMHVLRVKMHLLRGTY